MLKFLLKIWPALIPIAIYLLWVFVFEKLVRRISNKGNKIINAEYSVVDKDGDKSKMVQKNQKFSIKNPRFVFILYISLILAIISLISLAFH